MPVPSRTAASGLREKITSELEAGKYECLVCVDTIRSADAIWACDTCHVVLHLSCVREWAQRTGCDGGWQCPHCQHVHLTPVRALLSKCFCGKTRDPQPGGYNTPHTCEKVCLKVREGTACQHPCKDPCHPGPCDPCMEPSPAKPCHCGKTTYVTGCSEKDDGRTCGDVCGRTLVCEKHRCEAVCHPGPCAPCAKEYPQRCFCGKRPAEVRGCTPPPGHVSVVVAAAAKAAEIDGVPATYSCAAPCGRTLSCANHVCELDCHAGPCPPCPRDPKILRTCACGKAPGKLVSKCTRASCLDPIPTCSSICGKKMSCGRSGHTCPRPCHDGPCGDCVVPTTVACTCGTKRVMLTCRDARAPEGSVVTTIVQQAAPKKDLDIFSGGGGKKNKGGGQKKGLQQMPAHLMAGGGCRRGNQTGGGRGGGYAGAAASSSGSGNASPTMEAGEAITLPLTCATRCRAQKSCKKHTCDQVCCPMRGEEHICVVPCGKPLSCGNHRCDRLCHLGRCPECLESSFTELECACGATAIEPPVPCGTPPPQCPLPCQIPRLCGHPANHHCHFGDCPPCLAMVIKNCASHDLPCAWLTPCHVPEVSCKNPCKKLLACGRHNCPKQCHVGPCPETCGRKCARAHPSCAHACDRPCHAGPCPPCERNVRAACPCGKHSSVVSCGMRAQARVACEYCDAEDAGSRSTSASSAPAPRASQKQLTRE